jgi:TIR domain
MKSVFLSYASDDRASATRLYDALITHDVPIWMAPTDILPGEEWQGAIDQSIRDFSHVVVLLSKHSVVSKEVEAEWSLGIDLGKTIVPVLIEPVEVPYRLRRYQHVPHAEGGIGPQVDRLLAVLPQIAAPSIVTPTLPRDVTRDAYVELRIRVLGQHEGVPVFVDPRRFATFHSLLNEVFARALSNIVPPYSYGSQWLINGEPFGTAVLAPLEWVERPGMPVSEIAPDWIMSVRPMQVRLLPGSRWDITIAEPRGIGGLRSMEEFIRRPYGVVTNCDRVAEALTNNAKAFSFLSNRFQSGTVADARSEKYKYEFVFSDWLSSGFVGHVAIDSDDEPPRDVERFLRW